VLIIGVNPYWRPDEAYTAFAAMAARQLGVMITDAVSYQNERRRQQALEELDRAWEAVKAREGQRAPDRPDASDR